jgi:hypothetical protein
MRAGGGAAVAVAVLAAGAALAQEDACALISREEFEALTGKPSYSDPTGMPWGGGSVCGFDNGQIMLFPGEGSRATFDQFLAGFGQQDLPRTPIEGLGPDAFALFYDPESEYQDHGAMVVFGAGPPTVSVTVYAEDGEPPEAALPEAMAVARAVAEKLP